MSSSQIINRTSKIPQSSTSSVCDVSEQNFTESSGLVSLQDVMEDQNAKKTMGKEVIMSNILINIIVLITAGFITYKSFYKATVLFSWHPTCMSIGFLIAMTQAILAISDRSFLTFRLSHKQKILVHWILQALAAILIGIGFGAIYANKWRNDKPHFTSTHGIIGLVTVIFTVLSICGGIFTLYAFELRQRIRPVYTKIIHGIAGCVTCCLGFASICLGINSQWFAGEASSEIRISLLAFIVIVGVYIVIRPLITIVTRIKSSLRSNL